MLNSKFTTFGYDRRPEVGDLLIERYTVHVALETHPLLLGLLSGQLLQTVDGRLVAVGPGNTLVEVGTLVDPRLVQRVN